ncbi:hypothetical protein [Rhizobacter sp. OV335]|uniref:hypothetical protein n=1 Tax=Rhizobacter sp. OV335 TaxID=1500264 RepID=UPI000914D726|nr:hypothetical protein [Rhizobacter sp. OV335]SHN18066.1 hypothetical protein SAMN02787076_03850 [Rhizobacter sp. OV335]
MTTSPTPRKTAAKTTTKTAAAPARKTPVAAKKVAAKKAAPTKATAPTATPVAEKPKHKLVRDSFTIPKSEYQLLDALKLRAAALKRPTKKSEILRAGIAALNAMADKALLAALNSVPSLKTGRPKADDGAAND